MQQLIKYTGSKRFQAEEIIKHIPKKGTIYCELFLGSGAIFYKLLEQKYDYDFYVLNDINKDVIELHKYLLFGDLEEVLGEYDTHRENLLNNGQDYYYEVRNKFNELRLSSDFLFLNRNCVNGLIRYNKKNEFNAPFHHNRNGIKTIALNKIICFYRDLVGGRQIDFYSRNFQDLKTVHYHSDDFVYLDPPYSNSQNSIYGKFVSKSEIEKYINNIDCNWGLSYNGIRGEQDFQSQFNFRKPTQNFSIKNSKSSFDRLFNEKQSNVSEYYYTNILG